MASKHSKFKRFMGPHIQEFAKTHDEQTKRGLKWLTEQDHLALVELLEALVDREPEKLRFADPNMLKNVHALAQWALVEQMLRLAEEENDGRS